MRIAALLGVSLIVVVAARSVDAQTTWTGSGPGLSWGASANWNPATPPGAADAVLFTDAGAAILPGIVTNGLDQDRTVSALIYNNTAGKHHTTDLAGFDLTVAGDVYINTNQAGPSTSTIRNGALIVDSPFATFNVGRTLGLTSSGVGNLSGLTSFSADLSELHVGSGGTSATGELLTPALTHVVAGEAFIGDQGRGTWRLKGDTTIGANRLKVGTSAGTGLVEMLNPGSVTLGSATQSMELIVGKSTGINATTLTSAVNLTGASVDAHLATLIVGQKDDSTGVVNASLVAGDGGSFVIGANQTGQFIVGDTKATGLVDLARVDTLNASLDLLRVGAGASGVGTALLARDTTLDARRVIVGESTSGTSASGSLRLGDVNNLLIDELKVGVNSGQGTLDGPPATIVNLGSAERPTEVSVAQGSFNINTTLVSRIDLSNSTLNAHLQSLVVGKKDGLPGKHNGTFLGGNAGSMTVGSPEAPGVVIVADSNADGLVDLAAMDDFTAHLSALTIGVGGASSGTLRLPDTANITADIVTVGNSSDASLHLGKNATILADEFHVARNVSNAVVDVKAGGAVTLGSAERPVELTVAKASSNTNSTYTGTLDLSMTALTAHLSSLTVAQKDSLPGRHVGVFQGGNSGDLTLGSADARGNIIVGQDRASGSVDLSGMDTFTAYANDVIIGWGGSASGSVRLADDNFLDAATVIVGSSSEGGYLNFGATNTAFIDELHIARDYSSGTVDLRAGGVLQLGSPSRRTYLTVAKQVTNTNTTYSGVFDMSAGTVQAYFGQVILGEKNTLPGAAQATFSIGNSSGNYVDAQSIVMGGVQTSATLNFGGGTLVAGSITRGDGGATFNWTGGRLQVGTFGASTRLFNLNNQGTGTLAPGPATGATQIFGDYTQSSLAATEIELGGLTPGVEFDQIAVTGRATLAGKVDVKTSGGYVPLPGTSFEFLLFATRTGAYGSVVNSTPFAGLMFDVTYTSTKATLNVSATPGDANLDGIVSGADYTIWADNFGQTDPTWLEGDFNGDDSVTGADYTLWADHFGETLQPAFTSVPEPSSIVLSAAAAATLFALRRRGGRSPVQRRQ